MKDVSNNILICIICEKKKNENDQIDDSNRFDVKGWRQLGDTNINNKKKKKRVLFRMDY